MSSPISSHIYTGLWVNWSHGRIVGSTITLSGRDGAYLTAFLAIFVTAAGAACWKIMSYTLHQSRARKEFQSGLHQQQQAILRNTSTPDGAAWQFTQLVWYWRKRADKPLRRTLLLAALALLNLVIFGVAGIFSSEVTKAAGDEVLVQSRNCGQLFVNDSLTTDSAPEAAYIAIIANDTEAASTYSQACYGNTGNVLQCDQYAQQQIPWNVNSNASCPFGDDRCFYGSISAYEMDTGYIDSHKTLGMNAPESDRMQWRKVSTCSPIQRSGYSYQVNVTDHNEIAYGDTLDQFAFGPNEGVSNYTYSYNEHSTVEGFGYFITPLLAYAGLSTIGWLPAPALNRTDADVSIFFLAPNSVAYLSPVEDPFFAANIPTNVSDQGVNTTFFSPDYFVYVLACIDQYQSCNPTNGKCTSLTASNLLITDLEDLELNVAQTVANAHFMYSSSSQATYFSVISRGANALRASQTLEQSSRLGAGLPNNQWQLEVSSWFAVSMARLQQAVVTYATGPAYFPPGATFTRPSTKAEMQLCKQQKIRNANGTISFSVLGVFIILIIGGILIFTGLVVDSIMGFLRRKLHWQDYKALQWTLDEKLQLQRLAYEEAGMGEWSGGINSVPVTRKGDMFGIPKGVDVQHPRLGTKSEHNENLDDGTAESVRLMTCKGTGYRSDPVID